jgi:hypothetical protein
VFGLAEMKELGEDRWRISGVNTVAKAGTKAYISEISHMNPSSRQPSSRSIPRFFHPLFWPILALTILIGLIEWNDQQVLSTDAAPYGMLSLARRPCR